MGLVPVDVRETLRDFSRLSKSEKGSVGTLCFTTYLYLKKKDSFVILHVLPLSTHRLIAPPTTLTTANILRSTLAFLCL